MDRMDGHRAQFAEAVELAVQYGQKMAADKMAGMISLFGEPGGDGAAGIEPTLPVVEPWAKSKMLKEERDAVGFYVSGHPLESFLAESRAFASAQIVDVVAIVEQEGPADDGWAYRNNRPQHTLCGVLTEVQHRVNKSGKPFAICQFEDFTGQAELICFSNSYDKVQRYLMVDEIVLIRGSLEMRGGTAKVIASDVSPMWKVREQMVKSLILRLSVSELRIEQVLKLDELIAQHKGSCKLYFDLVEDSDTQPCRILSRTAVIDPNEEVMRGLSTLFGHRAITVEGGK